MNYSYHNTTSSSGEQLNRFEGKAKSQEERILEWIKRCPSFLMSPSDVRKYVFNSEIPLTSVRRALTNLTTSLDLVKTDQQLNGPYGRPEYLWRLADKHRQRSLL